MSTIHDIQQLIEQKLASGIPEALRSSGGGIRVYANWKGHAELSPKSRRVARLTPATSHRDIEAIKPKLYADPLCGRPSMPRVHRRNRRCGKPSEVLVAVWVVAGRPRVFRCPRPHKREADPS